MKKKTNLSIILFICLSTFFICSCKKEPAKAKIKYEVIVSRTVHFPLIQYVDGPDYTYEVDVDSITNYQWSKEVDQTDLETTNANDSVSGYARFNFWISDENTSFTVTSRIYKDDEIVRELIDTALITVVNGFPQYYYVTDQTYAW
tara:strand:+ start:269 stop:706 length:438 start_codon:yes stop_codon:yes gene_type:complete